MSKFLIGCFQGIIVTIVLIVMFAVIMRSLAADEVVRIDDHNEVLATSRQIDGGAAAMRDLLMIQLMDDEPIVIVAEPPHTGRSCEEHNRFLDALSALVDNAETGAYQFVEARTSIESARCVIHE